jgi:cardiolipin synthase (CMP-forming)
MSLPNYITIFRIFLVPFFFSFLVYYNVEHPSYRLWALGLFLVAVATDALDGTIARSTHQQSELGTFLDPLADKLLLLSGFLGIAFSEAFEIKPHMWIVIVIVFRDLFIVCGLAIIFFTTNQLQVKPNLLGKSTTFFQMLTLVAVLSQWKLIHPVSFVTVGLTILSSVAYLVRGIKLLKQPLQPSEE